MNNYAADPSYEDGSGAMAHKNERVELEMKVRKYRELMRKALWDSETIQRFETAVAEMEQKLREIDE
jgi:hypothetical protein